MNTIIKYRNILIVLLLFFHLHYLNMEHNEIDINIEFSGVHLYNIIKTIAKLDSVLTYITFQNNKLILSSEQENTYTSNAYFVYVFYLEHSHLVRIPHNSEAFQICCNTKRLLMSVELYNKFNPNKNYIKLPMKISLGKQSGKICISSPKYSIEFSCEINSWESVLLLDKPAKQYMISIGEDFIKKCCSNGVMYFNLNFINYTISSFDTGHVDYFGKLIDNDSKVQNDIVLEFISKVYKRHNEFEMIPVFIGIPFSKCLLKCFKKPLIPHLGYLFTTIIEMNGSDSQSNNNNLLQYTYTLRQDAYGNIHEGAFYILNYYLCLKMYNEIIINNEHLVLYENYINSKYNVHFQFSNASSINGSVSVENSSLITLSNMYRMSTGGDNNNKCNKNMNKKNSNNNNKIHKEKNKNKNNKEDKFKTEFNEESSITMKISQYSNRNSSDKEIEGIMNQIKFERKTENKPETNEEQSAVDLFIAQFKQNPFG